MDPQIIKVGTKILATIFYHKDGELKQSKRAYFVTKIHKTNTPIYLYLSTVNRFNIADSYFLPETCMKGGCMVVPFRNFPVYIRQLSRPPKNKEAEIITFEIIPD